jgi:flagellar biosynthetic protein FliP
MKRAALLIVLIALPVAATAAPGLPALTIHSDPDGGQTWSLTVQILVLMTALTLLPAIVLMMTSFTRVIIVLAFLRQALGTAQTPPNQVLIGLALFLTFFIMSPVFTKAYNVGVEPYLNGQASIEQAAQAGVKPLRRFMLHQTRDADLAMFAHLSGRKGFEKQSDVPLSIVVAAFVTSELKTAFEIGFLIYIPFVIIDLVVASVLMSMGMMMLSPMLVSLPFKIMLFVLVDGWSLLIGTLASSFYQ